VSTLSSDGRESGQNVVTLDGSVWVKERIEGWYVAAVAGFGRPTCQEFKVSSSGLRNPTSHRAGEVGGTLVQAARECKGFSKDEG